MRGLRDRPRYKSRSCAKKRHEDQKATNKLTPTEMNMNRLQRTLVLACLLPAVLVMWVEASPSCLLNDAELMKQRRIQTLRNSILAQLGVSDPQPEVDSEPLPGEEEMKETFNALRSASASLEREKERRCHSEDFYAKPVSSFVGVVSEGVY